jgi:hypothetical protein
MAARARPVGTTVVARAGGRWHRFVVQKVVVEWRATLGYSGTVGGWSEVAVVDEVPAEEEAARRHTV